MSKKIFIDGQTGTTGLEVRMRLSAFPDLELLEFDSGLNSRGLSQRVALAQEADLTISCLPDFATREFMDAVDDNVRIIDASSVHRVVDGWVYGLPELTEGQRTRIQSAPRVSNPGCYATGVLLLIRPLVDNGLLPAKTALSIFAQSGYSGGGKTLIAKYQKSSNRDSLLGSRSYSLNQKHKHMPEIRAYSGLSTPPIFVPSVSPFYRGILIQIPIRKEDLYPGKNLHDIPSCWDTHYADDPGINSLDDFSAIGDGDYIDPRVPDSQDKVELFLAGDEDLGIMLAKFDNLGKGAAGASVQNLNLMLDLPEHQGLNYN